MTKSNERKLTIARAMAEATAQEMRIDPSVFVMGEDIGHRGGVFLATDGFIEQFGEERVIDTPLAESSIAGIALGAAMHGMRPIAEIEFADRDTVEGIVEQGRNDGHPVRTMIHEVVQSDLFRRR